MLNHQLGGVFTHANRPDITDHLGESHKPFVVLRDCTRHLSQRHVGVVCRIVVAGKSFAHLHQ